MTRTRIDFFRDVLEKHFLYASYKKFKVNDKTIFKYVWIRKKVPIFTVIPTFRCNINCDYCQYKGLEKSYPKDMDLGIFSKVLDWLAMQDVKYIRFMGGELTSHPRINEYLKIINEKDFEVRFFSNLLIGTDRLKKILEHLKPEKVERFIIHYKSLDWYSKERHELFLRNVKEVSDRGYTIHLRHNLESRNTEYDYVIDLAKKYNIKFFTTTPLFPGATKDSVYTSIEEWKKLVPNILDIYKKCHEAGILFDFTKPLPPCFFTKEDFKRYYYKFVRNPCLKGKTLFMPLLYPDLTVCLCPGMHMNAPKKLFEYENYKDIYFSFEKKFESIRWTPLFEKCKDCRYFKQKRCQGLCAAFHYRKICSEQFFSE